MNEWNAVLTAGKNDQNWADTFWLNSRPKDICNRNCTRSDEDVQAGKGYPVVWDISQKYFGYSLVKKAAIEENQCLHVKLEDSKVWTYETCNNQHDALCVKRGCEDPNRK